MKYKKSTPSEIIKKILAKPVPVHRILPTIREYGNGEKTYHLELWKQYRRHDNFYFISNDKKREYVIDVSDEAAMDRLAKDLAELLKKATNAQIIVTQTYNEFVLHSKPKKVHAGHYHYRGYTIYDRSYVSKEWVVIKGEHVLDYYDIRKTKEPSPPFHNKFFRTLRFCMENIDIHLDSKLSKNSQNSTKDHV